MAYMYVFQLYDKKLLISFCPNCFPVWFNYLW